MSNNPPPPPHGGSGSRGNGGNTGGNSNASNNNSERPHMHFVYDPQVPSLFRRSSYASVLAGGSSAGETSSNQLPHPFQPPSRLSQTATPSSSFPPPSQPIGGISRTRSIDMGTQHISPWPLKTSAGPAGASGLFGSITSVPGESRHGLNKTENNGFFIPSYLQQSRYAERLAEQNAARIAHARDTKSPYSSAPGSLSTSSSSINLQSQHHKLVPSHRGLTHDVIEHAPRQFYGIDSPPFSFENPPQPLPTKWNEADRNTALEVLAGGLEVRLAHSTRRSGDEASSIRADHPMPRMAGIYYFEVTILGNSRGGSSSSTSSSRESVIGIGFAGPNCSLNRLPGWEPNSWAYHGDDGQIYATRDQGKQYGGKFSGGNVVGCGVNFKQNTAFFTRDGVPYPTAFRDIKGDKLFPIIGLKKPNEHVRVNFGQHPFVFDINAMIESEKASVMDDILRADTSILYPPLSESQLIHQLIAQYLSHDGYVETARAFSQEVAKENTALNSLAGTDPIVSNARNNDIEPVEDHDAIIRQKIRSSILTGDIDTALDLTRTHYPGLISTSDMIYFRLRCRKFAEMVLLRTDSHTRHGKKPLRNHRPHPSTDDGVFGHQMELDDSAGVNLAPSISNGDTWDANMEDAGLTNGNGATAEIVTDVDLIEYGQELQKEFVNDPRRDVRRTLERTMALMAYPDPRNSNLSELLDESGRNTLTEELNSAILVSQGKASSAALERLVQQTSVLLSELGDDGGPGAFINLTTDFLRRSSD